MQIKCQPFISVLWISTRKVQTWSSHYDHAHQKHFFEENNPKWRDTIKKVNLEVIRLAHRLFVVLCLNQIEIDVNRLVYVWWSKFQIFSLNLVLSPPWKQTNTWDHCNQFKNSVTVLLIPFDWCYIIQLF